MKRYISRKDCEYYTYMLEIINGIGGRNLEYNWLITNIDIIALEWNFPLNKEEYVFMSNDELLDFLEKNNFQWIWGIFSAIPKEYSKEDVLKYELPNIHKTVVSLYDDFVIQHPLADFEIAAIDTSYVHITSKVDEIAEAFKKAFPLSEENYRDLM